MGHRRDYGTRRHRPTESGQPRGTATRAGRAGSAVTYTDEDLRIIAEAVGVPPERVKSERRELESAATWFRLDDSTPKRAVPSVLQRELSSIASAARKLADRLDQEHILDELAIAPGGNEAVRCVNEYLRDLAYRADIARIRRRKAYELPERGDPAVSDWITNVLPIYQRIAQKVIGTSISGPLSRVPGVPTGPLIRFLKAAAGPLELALDPAGWRARVRRAIEIRSVAGKTTK